MVPLEDGGDFRIGALDVVFVVQTYRHHADAVLVVECVLLCGEGQQYAVLGEESHRNVLIGMGDHSHNLVDVAVDSKVLPNGIVMVKQLGHYPLSSQAHLAVLIYVGVVQIAAVHHLLGNVDVVGRRYAGSLVIAAAGPGADLLESVEIGFRDIPQAAAHLLPDVIDVSLLDVPRAVGVEAAVGHGCSRRGVDYAVGRQVHQAADEALLHSEAAAYQHHEHEDAPEDAEHRKDAAHLLTFNGHEHFLPHVSVQELHRLVVCREGFYKFYAYGLLGGHVSCQQAC